MVLTYYDFTVSPLTASAYNSDDEPNENRVEGTHYGKRNFGTVELSGDSRKRKAKLIIYNTSGEEVWSRMIKREL